MDPISRRDALTTLGLGAAALVAAGGVSAAPPPGKTVAASGSAAEPKESEIGFKDGKFVLPPLPYDYAALEPAIDEQTMKLHHDIHAAGYVKGANAALEAIAAGTGEAALIGHWDNELAFNGSGHALHTMFWNNMKPKGSTPPSALAAVLKEDFGGQSQFEKLFAATAGSVQGSGWAILGLDALSKRLQVIQAEKHQNQTLQSITPILVLDVWEHAYYLKYQNKRADYVKAFFTIINYEDVAARYAKAVAAA